MVEMIAGLNRRQQRKPRRTGGSGSSRVAFLPGDTLAEYAYLGIGWIVQEGYPQPEVRLNYDTGTPGDYAGFDRFGRVVDHRWYDYGTSTDRDRYTYGYDRASNRLYRENTLASGRDELYGYDGVDRLVAFQRGDLNVTNDGITGTPIKAEELGLDMTGNWNAFLQKTSGTTDLNQTRDHNPVNEITEIAASVGTVWIEPVHDRAGNMTTLPKPSSPANGLTCKWDAWNRLVEVKDGQTVIARYEYDGLNRRLKSHIDSGSPSNPTGIDTYVHYYHNSAWQILETRQSDSPSAQPETLQPKHQYVWSQRYIDAPVLRDENTGANGLCDDQRLYYLNDANFNVTALLDTAGDAVERYVYSPYGVITIYDAAWTSIRSASSYANITLYTGRELDPETGLYYYRNRYYSAELGRFVSRDLMRYDWLSLNLIAYAHGSPGNVTDAMGLKVNEACAFQCEQVCAVQYPRVWQWLQYAGCVNGCRASCTGHTNLLCGYLDSWSQRYKDTVACGCCVFNFLDAAPLGLLPVVGPPAGAVVGVLDCACEILQLVQRHCNTGFDPLTIPMIGTTVADCLFDTLIGFPNNPSVVQALQKTLGEGFLWALGDSLHVIGQPPGCGRYCTEACRSWWNG